jgi:hypothetical protein
MRHFACIAALFLASGPALAETATQAPTPGAKVLEKVTVSGVQPGPRMWRVTNGEHTLWIMGLLSPLPSGMTWRSREAEGVIAQADEVLAPGVAEADVGAGDVFKMMLLAPSALAAIKNPGGKRLQDVLPAELYARWASSKQKYIGKDEKIERHRPMFASQDLYLRATAAAGLVGSGFVWNSIAAIAKTHAVKVTQTSVSYPLQLDKSKTKAGIASLANYAVDDIPCFASTIDHLDSDIELMRTRANAWATGDLDVLRKLRTEDFAPACRDVSDAAMSFQRRPEVEQQLAESWVNAARAALEKNRTSFAALPLSEILKPGGYLARLQSMGYQLHQPDEGEDEGLDEDELPAPAPVSAE